MAISPQIVMFVLLMLAVVQATKFDERRQIKRQRAAREAQRTGRLTSSTRGDEVDQLLHRTQQVRLHVLKSAH